MLDFHQHLPHRFRVENLEYPAQRIVAGRTGSQLGSALLPAMAVSLDRVQTATTSGQ